jgi:hypothetical protein
VNLLSPAQLLGYLALVLGVAAFLQRDDRRLRLLLVGECLVYLFHFLLLGNPPAAASVAVSATRNLLSLRWRAAWLALASVAANLALALAVGTHGRGWIPVVGSCLGGIAIFTLDGIPLRLLLLCSTALWLANNLLSGSVGGTILESLIATASISTIVRMALAARAARGAPREDEGEGAAA